MSKSDDKKVLHFSLSNAGVCLAGLPSYEKVNKLVGLAYLVNGALVDGHKVHLEVPLICEEAIVRVMFKHLGQRFGVDVLFESVLELQKAKSSCGLVLVAGDGFERPEFYDDKDQIVPFGAALTSANKGRAIFLAARSALAHAKSVREITFGPLLVERVPSC